MAKKENSGFTVADMNKHIKEGNFGRLYLFYGSEEYLKDFYINGITDAVLHGDTLNYITFDGKIIADKLREACETIPMFGDRLVILVRNSGIFKTQGIKNEDYVFGNEDDLDDLFKMYKGDNFIKKRQHRKKKNVETSK